MQDQKHVRKDTGVMSGIVAAIWHLVLRSYLFFVFLAIYIFMLLLLSLSGLIIVYSDSDLQGHYSTEPGVTINSIFLF